MNLHADTAPDFLAAFCDLGLQKMARSRARATMALRPLRPYDTQQPRLEQCFEKCPAARNKTWAFALAFLLAAHWYSSCLFLAQEEPEGREEDHRSPRIRPRNQGTARRTAAEEPDNKPNRKETTQPTIFCASGPIIRRGPHTQRGDHAPRNSQPDQAPNQG